MTEGFPPSSDMVELVVVDGKVKAHCLVCMVTLPQEIHYLNQAIVAWRDHRAEVDKVLNGAKGSDS